MGLSTQAGEASKENVKCKLHYKYSKRSAVKGFSRCSCEIFYQESATVDHIRVKLERITETGNVEELITFSRSGSRAFHDMGGVIRLGLGELSKSTGVSLELHTVEGSVLPCELEKVNNQPKKH